MLLADLASVAGSDLHSLRRESQRSNAVLITHAAEEQRHPTISLMRSPSFVFAVLCVRALLAMECG